MNDQSFQDGIAEIIRIGQSADPHLVQTPTEEPSETVLQIQSEEEIGWEEHRDLGP